VVDAAKVELEKAVGDELAYDINSLVAFYHAWRLLAEPSLGKDGLVTAAAWKELGRRGLPVTGFCKLRLLVYRQDGEEWHFRPELDDEAKVAAARAIWAKFLTDEPRWPVCDLAEAVNALLGRKASGEGDGQSEEGKGGPQLPEDQEERQPLPAGQFNDLLEHCQTVAKQVSASEAAQLAYALLASNDEPDCCLDELFKLCHKSDDFSPKYIRAMQGAALMAHRPTNRVAESNGQPAGSAA
jgi:hypothetical protein